MRVNREQLYTESLGCNIASDSASFESCQSQIHANQYVFQQHYPKFLVNYPFVPLTVNLDMRITTRIGSLERIKNESRKPNESGTNREMRTNQERIRKTERIMNCDIFATDPPQWKLRVYPPQWKLRVDPYSGNMVLIRQTPAVEIRKGDPTDGKA